jgi:hypothetical protein
MKYSILIGQKSWAKACHKHGLFAIPYYGHPLGIYLTHNRDISKVRKRQHQYPKFGHTQGEIFKKLQKSTLAFKGAGGLRKPSKFS